MRVMTLSQALRVSSGAVALIMGSAVIAMAQPPSPNAKTAEDRAIITTESSSGFLTAGGKATRVATEPLFAAHVRALDRVVGLSLTRRPANSATIDHAFASLPLPTRWSRDMAPQRRFLGPP